MLDAMLDLEAMGTGPNAAIVAIGAVKFDLRTLQIDDNTFYRVVDLKSSVVYGGTIDASTVIWWMQQSDEARLDLVKNGVNLWDAIRAFTAWLDNTMQAENTRIWGNGADFDNIILASAYKNTGMARPWNFRNNRCYRTVKNLFPSIKPQRTGTHHNALDDALSQAGHLIEIAKACPALFGAAATAVIA